MPIFSYTQGVPAGSFLPPRHRPLQVGPFPFYCTIHFWEEWWMWWVSQCCSVRLHISKFSTFIYKGWKSCYYRNCSFTCPGCSVFKSFTTMLLQDLFYFFNIMNPLDPPQTVTYKHFQVFLSWKTPAFYFCLSWKTQNSRGVNWISAFKLLDLKLLGLSLIKIKWGKIATTT